MTITPPKPESGASALPGEALPPLTDAMYWAARAVAFEVNSGEYTCHVTDEMLDDIWAAINTALRVQGAAPASPPAPPQQNEWLAEAERLIAELLHERQLLDFCPEEDEPNYTRSFERSQAALLSHLRKRPEASEPPSK